MITKTPQTVPYARCDSAARDYLRAHRSSRVLLAIVPMLIALVLAGAPAARAGTYSVHQCHESFGYANSGWSWWNNFNSGPGNPAPVEGCGSHFKLQASGSTSGTFAWWRSPVLPGDLGLVRVTSNYIGSSSFGRISGSAVLCTANSIAAPGSYGQCGGFTQVVFGDPGSDWTNGFTVGDCTTLGNPVSRCKAFQFSILQNSSTYGGAYWLRNLTFQIDDPSVGQVWQPHNGTLRSNESVNGAWGSNHWNSGTKTVQVAGYDPNSGGVKNTKIFFDGASGSGSPDHNFDQPCNYVNWQPCPAFASNLPTIDTTALADGPHTATTRVTDAGGNTADATVTFKVDNTPPSEPENIVAAAETAAGWQSVNDFDVSWTNAGETVETTTQSGIETICYDVDPADGQPSDPSEVCTTDPAGSSIDDISVPDDGRWNLEIKTRDRAGSESTPGVKELRLDTTVPGRPNGVANGWIGLAELIDGTPQRWSRPVNWTSINSGLCGYGFSLTPSPTDEAPTTINVTGDVTSELIPASTPEGVNWAHFRAISCAGLHGPTESIEIKIDLTDPQASVSGVPASGWTNAPGIVSVSGSDAMPGSGLDCAPDHQAVTDGASIRFEVDGSIASESRGAHDAEFDASSLAEGDHSLVVKTFDWARNFDEQAFTFGVDTTPPSGVFMGSDPEDPATFKLAATDELSGPAGGTIEYAPVDSDGNRGAYKPLATTYDAGTLTASFPDTKLPVGSYALRGKVDDVATNTGFATKDVRGREMVITTPLRQAVNLSLLAGGASKLCKMNRRAKSKAGRRHAVKRYRTCRKRRAVGRESGSTVTVAYGRRSELSGTLKDRDGEAMAGAKIELYEQRAGEPMRLVGGASTDQQGRFSYTAHPGPARNVIAYFSGNRKQRDVSASVTLNVPAKVAFRVSPSRVRGARRFTLSGKVFAQDGVSAEGKLVQLQFFNVLRGRWQAGPALIRTGKGGKFSYSYAIKRSATAREKLRFRAYVPSEASFPYGSGTSRARTLIHSR